MSLSIDSQNSRLVPNAFTAIRLVLVLPFSVFMAKGDIRSALFAGGIISVAIVTDFLDGYFARRKNVASSAGGTFDHCVDFLFVSCGLFSCVFRGTIFWIFPVLITTAFAQYFIDSRWIHRHRGLRGSWLGRVNGIFYFVPLCMDILIRIGFAFLRPMLNILVWALIISTLFSMVQRLLIKPSS